MACLRQPVRSPERLRTPPATCSEQLTNAAITFPLTGFVGTCTILTLHTGAINLSVLGLNVSLSPIDLLITATAAPGNLLGNLLCDVANLLNGGGPLSTLLGSLATLLNQILGAIRV